jgi:hypothetical protein
MLPLTVGQLSPFRYDSTANHELAYPGLECAIDSIADMLDHIAEEERHGVPYARTLDRECRVFTSHLIDREPDEYILARYRDAHEKVHELRLARPSMFDRALIAIASRSSFLARFVDVYTRVFAPHAMVRKKWILLLSLLEVSASTHALFDAPQKKRSVPVALALLAAGVRFSLFLCLSSLAFAPLHAACVGGASIRRRID